MIITRSIPYPSKRKKKKLHRRFQRNGVEHWPDVDTKVDVEQTVVDCFLTVNADQRKRKHNGCYEALRLLYTERKITKGDFDLLYPLPRVSLPERQEELFS